jgi:glycosyltransferase involved in cell wall biosynthesis
MTLVASRKLLSFCIPTYGQPSQLKRTLDSLLGQDLEEVEIVIRDDNPDSETEKIVSEYLTKLPIRYFHMSKEGVDLAFMFVSKEANGDFIWWFGDDVLCPGAIGRVVDILMHNQALDFMYVNSTDMSGSSYSVNIGGSRFSKDRNEVLSELKDQLGFCSAMLFKKETLLSGMNKAEKFVGTSWVTLFLSLNTLSVGKLFYLLDGKNFLSDSKPAGETRWYDSFEVHGLNYFVIAQEFKYKFDKKSLRSVLARKYGSAWRAVIVERALGFKTGFASPSPKIKKMAKLYWSYPEFYIAFPLMLMPRAILRMFYALYKGINNLRR